MMDASTGNGVEPAGLGSPSRKAQPMSYLDELNDILNAAGAHEQGQDGAHVVSDNPLTVARGQLESSRHKYWEGPEGTFHMSGVYFGCGFADATATYDEQTGTFSLVVNTHLHIDPQNASAARKVFRRLNADFILEGLQLGEDGTMLFVAKRPCDVAAGDDLDEFFGKALSTVHGNASIPVQFAAGRGPLDILHADDEEEDGSDERDGDDDDTLSMLHRLFS